MRVVFLGPPGAGKGTQAEVVAEETGIAHVSTGAILRQAVADGTLLGKKAREYMDSGKLVPDEVVVKLVAEKLASSDLENGYILDGFPRTIAQARALDSELEKNGDKLDVVVYFETSEETIKMRLTGRRVCRECGANYHVTNMKPRKEGICDRYGGEIYQREDDRLETIMQRVEVYHSETSELIDYYRDQEILREVSGDKGVEELRGTLLEMLSQREA